MKDLTPQEYAVQLIDKYAINVVVFAMINGEEYIPEGLLTTKSSVKFAIMEVDAIMTENHLFDDYSVELTKKLSDRYLFLNSVKQELLNAL